MIAPESITDFTRGPFKDLCKWTNILLIIIISFADDSRSDSYPSYPNTYFDSQPATATVSCSPDGFPQNTITGICASTAQLNSRCALLEISSSGADCAAFEGHWCCYGQPALSGSQIYGQPYSPLPTVLTYPVTGTTVVRTLTRTSPSSSVITSTRTSAGPTTGVTRSPYNRAGYYGGAYTGTISASSTYQAVTMAPSTITIGPTAKTTSSSTYVYNTPVNFQAVVPISSVKLSEGSPYIAYPVAGSPGSPLLLPAAMLQDNGDGVPATLSVSGDRVSTLRALLESETLRKSSFFCAFLKVMRVGVSDSAPICQRPITPRNQISSENTRILARLSTSSDAPFAGKKLETGAIPDWSMD